MVDLVYKFKRSLPQVFEKVSRSLKSHSIFLVQIHGHQYRSHNSCLCMQGNNILLQDLFYFNSDEISKLILWEATFLKYMVLLVLLLCLLKYSGF